MKKLENQVAIVTGASKGIGRASALAFAREGASVVVAGRNAGDLRTLAAEIEAAGSQALAIAADIGERSTADRIAAEAIARFGRVDILINGAAVIPASKNLVDTDPAEWREVIDVNLVAPAMLIRAVLPQMIGQRYGKIVNLSSVGGRRGGKGRTAYRASKAALISLTESVAAEVKQHGIDVNCICPGGTDTEGYRNAFSSRGRTENPKLMAPEEIAAVIMFLVTPAGSAITGTAIDAFGATNALFA